MELIIRKNLNDWWFNAWSTVERFPNDPLVNLPADPTPIILSKAISDDNRPSDYPIEQIFRAPPSE